MLVQGDCRLVAPRRAADAHGCRRRV